MNTHNKPIQPSIKPSASSRARVALIQRLYLVRKRSMIISTTKFKLKKLSLYGRFFVDTYRVVKQVRRAGGVVHMRINPVTLRTVTVWKSREQMLEFRNSGAHLHAIKKFRSFGAITSTTWESDLIPTWEQAVQRPERSGLTNHCSGLT